MARRKSKAPAGWVVAPPEVELEIRGVWQEDEMPDEIKQTPGYSPFTLGAEAQAWVDSMADITDGGDAVFGRPRPAAPPTLHHSLTAQLPPVAVPPSPAATSSPASQTVRRPPPAPPSPHSPPPSPPRVLMPDINDVPPPPASSSTPPRPVMPDIDSASPPARKRTLPHRVLMPEIDGDDEQPKPKPPRPVMPDIG